MEVMALDLDSSEFGVGDFHTLWIFVFVQFGAHCESGSGGRCCDQLNDRPEATQGLSAPIEGNKGKQAMLDLVPLYWCRASALSRSYPGMLSRTYPRDL